jgi:hypothetical protein
MAVIIDILYSETPSIVDRDLVSSRSKLTTGEGVTDAQGDLLYSAQDKKVTVDTSTADEDITSAGTNTYRYRPYPASDSPLKGYFRKIVYGVYTKSVSGEVSLGDDSLFTDRSVTQKVNGVWTITGDINPLVPDFVATNDMFVCVQQQMRVQTDDLNSQSDFGTWVDYGIKTYHKYNDYPRIIAPSFNRQIRNYIGTERITEDELINGQRIDTVVNGNANYRWVGSAILDKLTAFINDNLSIQHDMDRIKGDQYGNAYIQLMSVAIQASIQYTLGKRQAETAAEKTLSATEFQQRQALGFDDNNAQKMLEQIVNLYTVVLGADSTEADSRLTRPGAIDAVIRDLTRFTGLPDSIVRAGVVEL